MPINTRRHNVEEETPELYEWIQAIRILDCFIILLDGLAVNPAGVVGDLKCDRDVDVSIFLDRFREKKQLSDLVKLLLKFDEAERAIVIAEREVEECPRRAEKKSVKSAT